MSRPVDERLREMESELGDLRVLPAADVRARGRRRGRRRVAGLLAAGAVVAVTAGIAAVQGWPNQRAAEQVPVGDGPSVRPVVSCVLALPDGPAAVRVRVVDGGTAEGLSAATASQLRDRDFTVETGDGAGGETRDGAVDAVALRYGPAAIGAAALLRAMLHDDATMRFDPARRDETIDLVLGPAFTRLATATETNQALAAGGPPSAPPGCAPGR
jgi:hypothetical protein